MRFRSLVWIPALLVSVGCGHGKKTPAGVNTVTVEGFLETFPTIKLPFTVGDSVLNRKAPDTGRISLHSWRDLIGDSSYRHLFRDLPALRLYPVGKAGLRSRGSLVLLRGISGHYRAVYAFFFDKKNRFVSAIRAAWAGENPMETTFARIDNEFNVMVTTDTRRPGSTTLVRERAYGLSEQGIYALLMTNSNEEVTGRAVYNPIDTFPRRNRWSADYTAGKGNIVSLRDGAGTREYRFFIHFVSDDGTCTGELRGVADVTGPDQARFTERRGPCGIAFRFDDNEVTIREVGGCGAYRGVNCYFEGNYERRKAPKAKRRK